MPDNCKHIFSNWLNSLINVEIFPSNSNSTFSKSFKVSWNWLASLLGCVAHFYESFLDKIFYNCFVYLIENFPSKISKLKCTSMETSRSVATWNDNHCYIWLMVLLISYSSPDTCPKTKIHCWAVDAFLFCLFVIYFCSWKKNQPTQIKYGWWIWFRFCWCWCICHLSYAMFGSP